MAELRVVSVAVRDVLGAREFNLAPGQINVLRGENGSGKSSALQAVQAALGGGKLANLARVAEDGTPTEPEVVLVLEGPGHEAYRVERSGERVRVLARVGDSAAFEDVPRPQTWLSGLFDPNGANPVRFLMAPDKDRALMLLEALPLRFDRPALLAEMGVAAEELGRMGAIPEGLHPLEEIGLIRDAVFRTRTGVSRDQKQREASATQLLRNIPAKLPEDLGARLDEESASVADLAALIAREEEAAEGAQREATMEAGARKRAARTDAEAAYAATQAEVVKGYDERTATIRENAERRIAEIRVEVERQVAADLERCGRVMEEHEAVRDRAIEAASVEEFAALDVAVAVRAAARALADEKNRFLQKRREELAALRAQASDADKARALAEQADAFKASAAELGAEAERLTAALAALDDYRRRLAEDLPIPGLTIEGKVIRVNGVVFEQLNTAQKVAIAVKVATLRARGHRLPVVFVDGAEALDAAHFDALCAELRANKVQAFIGRVADSPLTVEVA